MVPEALDTLSAEERHQVYKMLRLRVFAYPDGSLWRGAECSVRTLAFVKKKRYILAYDPQDVRVDLGFGEVYVLDVKAL